MRKIGHIVLFSAAVHGKDGENKFSLRIGITVANLNTDMRVPGPSRKTDKLRSTSLLFVRKLHEDELSGN